MSKRRRRKPNGLPSGSVLMVDPRTQMVQVDVMDDKDQLIRSTQVTLGELEATLSALERRGCEIRSNKEGVIVSVPVPPDPPPAEEPPTMAEEKREVQNPFLKEAHLDDQGRREFVRLCDILIARGKDWDQLNDICGYHSPGSARSAYNKIKAGEGGGSLAALKGLREAAVYGNGQATIPASQIAAATVTPDRIVVDPSLPWMERYQRAVNQAQRSADQIYQAQAQLEMEVLHLMEIIEEIPEDFRGAAMMEKLEKFRRLVESD